MAGLKWDLEITIPIHVTTDVMKQLETANAIKLRFFLL